MGKDPFLDAVAAIYDAALQPEAWPTALSRLGALLDSTWLMISALRPTGVADLVAQDEAGDPSIFPLFRDKYNAPDTNPSIPSLIASRPGTLLHREQQMTDEEWHGCRMYNDLYRPNGCYHGLGVLVHKTDSHVVLLGVNRPRKNGAFGECETGAISHVQRAMQVFLQLADLQSQKKAHETLWDTLACGVILLDREGQVLWTNRMATTILARSDGLSLRKRSLCAANAHENTGLWQLIRMTIATSEGRGVLPGTPIQLSRPSLVRPLALLIAPIRMERAFVRQPVVVVFVSDPERKSEPAIETLKRLYGLTAREAALATLLSDGTNLRGAAEQLGVSMNTARTHLRLIFEKTDTHRQAELVRLLAGSPPVGP